MLISISQSVNKVKVLVIKNDNDPNWLGRKGITGSNVFVEVGNLLSPEQRGRFWEQPHFQTVKIPISYLLGDRTDNFLIPRASRYFSE